MTGTAIRPKVLFVVSCLDLEAALGCTPAWWQLLKALWSEGVEVICTPYFGPPVTTLWWRCEDNPCRLEARLFSAVRSAIRAVLRTTPSAAGSGGGVSGALMKTAIAARIRPRWRRHLSRILERNVGISAVVVLTVPPAHLRGIPTLLRERHGVPVWFYDGDAPASLPEFGGFASGFQVYEGADLGEYDGVVCNSEGCTQRLEALGARSVHTVHWGADPEFFVPPDVPQDIDVGFYGIGERYREDWIRAMIGEPSRSLAEHRFAVFGSGFSESNIGRAEARPMIPFHRLTAELARVRVHLNITRTAHASVRASSSTRLFELAAMGGAIVSNPVEGLERWFEPGREVVVVRNAGEAVEALRSLLADPDARAEMGQRARLRVLEEHTYDHRAGQLLRIIVPDPSRSKPPRPGKQE